MIWWCICNEWGERHILYIHGYNHQLHLSIHAIQSEPCAKRLFDLSGSPCSFFRFHFISQKHSCPSLKRLLEKHWTSHFDFTKGVVENEKIILDILSKVSFEDDNTSGNRSFRASLSTETTPFISCRRISDLSAGHFEASKCLPSVPVCWLVHCDWGDSDSCWCLEKIFRRMTMNCQSTAWLLVVNLHQNPKEHSQLPLCLFCSHVVSGSIRF